MEAKELKTQETRERGLVEYLSRDGQAIRLSFDTVRKNLVSGKPELVNDQEIILYMGMCKARGLNPFKRDCYLIKYTPDDPAATIVSIDYFRSRARAQTDCRGWQCGIIVLVGDEIEHRKGSFTTEGETVLGGWFKARPAGWDVDYEWTISLKPFIKQTRDGKPTRFWREENQGYMIAKVAESQGLRRLWPDEFQGLFVHEEILDVTRTDEPKPLMIPKAKEPEEKKDAIPPYKDESRTNPEPIANEDGQTVPRKVKGPNPLDFIANATDDEFTAAGKNWLSETVKAMKGATDKEKTEVLSAWDARFREVRAKAL